MPEYNGKCAIWPEFAAYEYPAPFQDRNREGIFIHTYESPRASGRYHIDSDAQHELQQPDTQDELRKKVSWWLASQRRQHVETPRVTSDILAYLRAQPLLQPVERAEWLLWYLAAQSTRIGQGLTPSYQDTPHHYGALVVTQSESSDEIDSLISHLIQNGALQYADNQIEVIVTVDGFEELRQQTQAPDYAQAFVAMWLDDSVREIYDKGIGPAIERAGYKPYLVPDDLSADKIDDAIIANIRQSKFVVADFTHDDKGHRGSVYYEVGFADGLGLEVILTCRSDLIDDGGLAFDTRQRNHIGWDKDNTDYPAFTKELTNRIIARVGRGPIQGNA